MINSSLICHVVSLLAPMKFFNFPSFCSILHWRPLIFLHCPPPPSPYSAFYLSNTFLPVRQTSGRFQCSFSIPTLFPMLKFLWAISSLFSRSDGSEKKLHSLCVTIFLTTVTSWKQGRYYTPSPSLPLHQKELNIGQKNANEHILWCWVNISNCQTFSNGVICHKNKAREEMRIPRYNAKWDEISPKYW